MSEFRFEYPIGATPLDPDEIAGLKLTYISTQTELNAAEQDNILQGELWAFARKRKNFLDEKFLRELHKRMFGHVWKWAGVYRTTDKSIGITWSKIPMQTHQLLADVRYWIENETYPIDEIAARFHHRLVVIHPFPNGNGRWARAMADVLLFSLGQERFTWGAARIKNINLDQQNITREKYIHALKMADARKYNELLQFVRS